MRSVGNSRNQADPTPKRNFHSSLNLKPEITLGLVEGLRQRVHHEDGRVRARSDDRLHGVVGEVDGRVGLRGSVEPFLGQIVDGIHQAFSIAIANALWLGLFAIIAVAIVIVVRYREPLVSIPVMATMLSGAAVTPEGGADPLAAALRAQDGIGSAHGERA